MGSLAQHPAASPASTRSTARRCRQLKVEVEQREGDVLGVPYRTLFDASAEHMSALYVNDFKQVRAHLPRPDAGEARSGAQPEDLGSVYVRSNTTREMIPLKALIPTSNVVARAARALNASWRRKCWRRQAGSLVGRSHQGGGEVADSTLPEGYQIAWTGQAFQEKRTGPRFALPSACHRDVF